MWTMTLSNEVAIKSVNESPLDVELDESPDAYVVEQDGDGVGERNG